MVFEATDPAAIKAPTTATAAMHLAVVETAETLRGVAARVPVRAVPLWTVARPRSEGRLAGSARRRPR